MTYAPNPTVGEDPWDVDLDARLDDLQSHIEALEAGGSGTSTHPTSRAYGLGLGTPDGDALQDFFDALGNDFTEPGLDRAGHGAAGELSGGNWNARKSGHTIVAPTAGGSGNVNLKGQTGGATQIQLPDRGTSRSIRLGAVGSSQNLTSAVRSGNTFTLGFTGPWFPCDPTTGEVLAGSGPAPAPSASAPLCQVYDIIWVKLLNEGVLEWNAYTVTANHVGSDYTKIQYVAFGNSQATDACIPPVGGGVLAYFWGSSGYLGGVAISPFNFRNPHELHISDLTIKGLSNTGTPLDGCGIRHASGTYLEHTVVLTGLFVGELLCGSSMGPLDGTNKNDGTDSLYGAQNTDHNESAAIYASNTFNVALITNDQTNGARTDPTGGGTRSPMGGGRDNYWIGADLGAPGLAHFFLADDGVLQTAKMDLNTKNGADVFWGAGIAGVPCNSGFFIDRMIGYHKSESPANFVFNDRSMTRTIWGLKGYTLEMEAGLSVNGAGNNVNFAYQPYHLTNVTIAGSPGNGAGGTMAVLTATISESGHGLVVGTPVQIGNGGPTTTIDATQTAFHCGSSLPSSIKCTSLSGFPSNGQVLIGSTTGTQLISYTNISGNTLTGCTGGKTNALVNPGQGVTSQVLAHESAIKTIDAAGQVITMDLVDYTGPDLPTPATCQLGRMGFMRCGSFLRVEATNFDWDLDGGDRFVTAEMVFNVQTLGSVDLAMVQNSSSSASRKKMPIMRIRDFEGLAGTNGVYQASTTLYGATVTKVFSTPNASETQFNSGDVGKTIVTSAGTDTIAAFIDHQHVQLTSGITPGTGITWAITPKLVDDPSFQLTRGKRKYRLCHWSSAATVDILVGMGLELDTSDGRMGAIASTAGKKKRFIGFAMQARPAPTAYGSAVAAPVTVTNNGLTGTTGRVFINTSSFFVMEHQGAFVASDDVKPLATGAITQGAMVVDDGAANPGFVKTAVLTAGDPNAGQRSLGQALKTASGGTVALATEPPAWTP